MVISRGTMQTMVAGAVMIAAVARTWGQPASQPATGPASDQASPLPAAPADWPRWIAAAYDPERRWPSARFVRFDFVIQDAEGKETGRFRHLWDRETGDYRYECDAGEFAAASFLDEASGTWKPLGLKFAPGRLVALVSRKTGKGRVLIGGRPQADAIVRRVFERIDNDTFWLLLPLEPGRDARFQQIGPKQLVDGTPAIQVRLTYPANANAGAGVSATQPAAGAAALSRSAIWDLFLFPDNYEIVRTEATAPGSGKALAADWFGRVNVSGILFSTERRLANHTLLMDAISLPKDVPAGVFTDPAVALPTPTPPPQTQPEEE